MYILIFLLLSTGEQVAQEKGFRTEAKCEQRAVVVERALVPNKYRHVCFFDARSQPRALPIPQENT